MFTTRPSYEQQGRIHSVGSTIVVHGARGGTPQAEGEPVVHALRRVLATAHDSGEALRALAEHSAMVSHIVILNDANDFRANVASSYAAGG